MSAAATPAELGRLLTEVDDAGYWTEHLMLCADLVIGPMIDKHMAGLQDGQCAQFLLEETKAATVRMRRAADALATYLKAGAQRPGGPVG